MTDKYIVVLVNTRHFEDRSWACQHKGEAERMAQWLSENGTDAIAMSLPEWNTAHDTWKQEQDQ